MNLQNINPTSQFEVRKREHLQLALRDENEAIGYSGFDSLNLWHEALPEIDFKDVNLQTVVLGENRPTPFFVSSMTAGHRDSKKLNVLLAKACSEQGWIFGVGSQRRELDDPTVCEEWQSIRLTSPELTILGNLGLSQVIQTKTDKIQRLVDAVQAKAMIVHLNSLQECLQPEGTPQFKGGLQRISQLAAELSVPVVVKETGCGLSESTLRRLKETKVVAVDVSGFGGTHWGRIEGHRSPQESLLAEAAKTFSHWGISTVESLACAKSVDPNFEVWASGGVRSGLDSAKAIALGASAIGFAKPILQAAILGEEALLRKMKIIELELKIALFCTGCRNLGELIGNEKVLKWHRKA